MNSKGIVAIILVLISLLFIFISQLNQQQSSISSFKLLNFTGRYEKRIPKILAWTPYFTRRLDDRIRSDSCPFQCEVYNRSQLSEESADVIVFHFRDLHRKMPLPKTRRSDQIYVSFLKEAPVHAGSAVYMRKFAVNFFNTTVDYRLNNFTYFDHSLIAPAVTEEEKKKMKQLSEEGFDKIYRNKTGAVLAIISNCHAMSGRMEYIKELDKFINVTKVGGCFGKRRSNEEVEEMIKSHYFVIAFENIVCRDYATEKFWRITKDIVPIVLQRRILKGIAPDSSFVAADDFDSPEKMAKHLNKVIASREEYRKYFSWRNTHYVNHVDGFCNLCRDLHFKNVSTSSHLNMKEYYSVERECEGGL